MPDPTHKEVGSGESGLISVAKIKITVNYVSILSISQENLNYLKL